MRNSCSRSVHISDCFDSDKIVAHATEIVAHAVFTSMIVLTVINKI